MPPWKHGTATDPVGVYCLDIPTSEAMVDLVDVADPNLSFTYYRYRF
jgi:hypothetical protein